MSTDTRPEGPIESLPAFLSAPPADGVALTMQIQDNGLVKIGSPSSLTDFFWNSAWFSGMILMITIVLSLIIPPLIFVFWIPGAFMVVFLLLHRFLKFAYYLDIHDRRIIYRRTFFGLKKEKDMDLDRILCVRAKLR